MSTFRNLLRTTALAAGVAALLVVPASADFVISDDLIVDGSACLGFDCVNGESFGFDTLRLKENNLRIRFFDTSSSASFPTRDWEITVNDSSNGGAEKFSITDIDGGRIPFTIEAGAPSNSLFVDDGGRIGLGTGTPVVEVHIVDGDTPTLRLEQDGSSGFTPQTWDVAGNETNFFVRDATSGSKLPFRIRPAAPSNSIFVDLDGDVGMGTSSPANALHLLRTTNATTGVDLQNSAGAGWGFEVNTVGDFQITEDGTGGVEFRIFDTILAGNATKYEFSQAGNQLVIIQADGDVQNVTGVYGTISDRNMKIDIQDVDAVQVLERVAAMPISTWRFRDNSDELHMGPMAQDFWAAFGLHEGETSLSVNDLAGVALAAIKGVNEKLAAKDTTIEQLLDRVAALEERLAER